MPTQPTRFLVALFLLVLSSFLPLPAHASTDPLSATVSATARVPSTTPTTGDTTAPIAVILVSPADNTTTGANRPELVWKQTTDPNSNTLYYTVYLNGVATFLGVSNVGNSQMHNYLARLSDGQVLLTPTFDLPDGNYTWSVAASDLSSNTSYSTTWHFTVDTTPPPLLLTNVDDLYLNPPLSEGTNFDLPGPQAVTLTFLTEPWATVSLTLTLPDATSVTQSVATQASGIASFTLNLPLGVTQVSATSIDHSAHTTALPLFTLTLHTTPASGLLTTLRLTPPSNLPVFLTPLTSLPATVSQISTPYYLTLAIYVMLAMIALLLLILIWQRRPNLYLYHTNPVEPARSLIVYHSRPTHSASFRRLPGRLFVTSHAPVLYSLPNGKVYIPHLGRYSTLTIRSQGGTTHILSLCTAQKSYVLYL